MSAPDPNARMRDLLIPQVKVLMRDLGYRKRATTWHFETPDLIRVLNLQKSQWGDDYYVNAGIFIKEIRTSEDPPLPPEYRTHARCRAEDLLEPAVAESLRGWPQGQTVTERAAVIFSLVHVAVPWLAGFTDLADFARIDPTNHRLMIRVEARRLMEDRGFWPPSELTGDLGTTM